MLRSQTFRAADLVLVRPAAPPPKLRAGDRCQLASGGPRMLVVGFRDDGRVIYRWPGADAADFDRRTVRAPPPTWNR